MEERLAKLEVRTDAIERKVDTVGSDVKKLMTNCIPTVDGKVDRIGQQVGFLREDIAAERKRRNTGIDRALRLLPYVAAVALSAAAWWLSGSLTS